MFLSLGFQITDANKTQGSYTLFMHFFILKIPVLWYSQSSDYQQEDLAKFGYRPDMKVEIKNPFFQEAKI